MKNLVWMVLFFGGLIFAVLISFDIIDFFPKASDLSNVIAAVGFACLPSISTLIFSGWKDKVKT